MVKTIALYDDRCALCQKTKTWFLKFDWLQRVKWISLQEFEKEDRSHAFSAIDLRRELHIILPSGRLHKGFFAVRRLFIYFPLTFLLGLILYIPFMPLIGVPIYKWIAKNRYHFLKGRCDNGSCSL